MNIRKHIYNNHWTLGFIESPIGDILNGKPYKVRWLDNPYNNRWFADPFLLFVDGKEIHVLVEEFYDPINRGRISRLIIDRKSLLIKSITPILELPTHLSFPAIIRDDDKVYIYPENSASGNLDLYLYSPDSNKCEFVKNLCKQPLTDAICTSIWGEKLIFSTQLPTQNKNVLSYYAMNSDSFSKSGEIIFNSNIARNAGDWFVLNGDVFRPAQDCTTRYGGAVIIQKVIKQKDSYSFENILRIEEKYANYTLGCHTFNYLDGIAVIDVNGYRRPLIANTIKRITALRITIAKLCHAK